MWFLNFRWKLVTDFVISRTWTSYCYETMYRLYSEKIFKKSLCARRDDEASCVRLVCLMENSSTVKVREQSSGMSQLSTNFEKTRGNWGFPQFITTLAPGVLLSSVYLYSLGSLTAVITSLNPFESTPHLSVTYFKVT